MTSRQLIAEFLMLANGLASGLAADGREALAIKSVESFGGKVERDGNDPKGSVIEVAVMVTNGGNGRAALTDSDLNRMTALSTSSLARYHCYMWSNWLQQVQHSFGPTESADWFCHGLLLARKPQKWRY
jgi:hypothetical protein